ncbi:hypothetical protein BGX38DRAFT_1206433 [Terfezia claveryi]|nr:hypothetical protein BGX38DRAFT_1206433 [Terfezia claveryi]
MTHKARTDASGIMSASEFRRLALAKYRLGLLRNVDLEFLRGHKPSRSQELLTHILSCYPILESITKQAHYRDMVSLMDTSPDIHSAVLSSWHILWKYSCHWGGTSPPTSGVMKCYGCSCRICVGCRTQVVFPVPSDARDLEEEEEVGYRHASWINIRHPMADDIYRSPRFYCSDCARTRLKPGMTYLIEDSVRFQEL